MEIDMEKDKTQVITATELKSNLGRYIDYVSEDNEVVITKNGKKSLRLTPYITDIEKYFVVRERSLDYAYGGKKVSYEEFLEISERSDLRMEYINGEIIILSSPDVYHQYISGNLHIMLRNHFNGKKCRVFYAPFNVHLYKIGFKNPDVMQPDVMVICDLEERINEKKRYMGVPSLVIEILSSSTQSRDMVDKLNTFMLSGVKEYWVVDPAGQTVLVYGFKDYQIDTFVSCKLDGTVNSNWFEGLSVSVADIFEGCPPGMGE